MPLGLMKFLHLFFDFGFVASLLGTHMNVLAARRSSDWTARAALLESNRRIGMMLGLGSLVLLGIFGNLVAVLDGLSMAAPWLRWVNGVWLATLLIAAMVERPAASKLAALARAAVGGGASTGYDAALARWRAANAALLVAYVALLVLMVVRR